MEIRDSSHLLSTVLLKSGDSEDDVEHGKERQSSTSSIRTDLSTILPPLSYVWSMMHVLLYVIGGTAFLLGSACYLPRADHPAKGAYLFIMGATGFMLSDLAELRSSIYDCYVEQKERRHYHRDQSKRSLLVLIWNSEDALSVCMMALGSTMYFVGCVLFIPEFDPVWGDILFIVGSVIIDFAEGWKLYRLGSSQYSVITGELERVPFEWKILFDGNLTLLYGDLCNFFGVFIFLVGSILFLPGVCLTDQDERRAAFLFIVGSFLFAVCGCFMFYDYFISKRPVDEYE